MEDKYFVVNTLLFIEQVNSSPGITFMRYCNEGEVKLNIYRGTHGRSVMIDISDEDMEGDLALEYIDDLGLTDSIDFFRPLFIEVPTP